MTEKQWLSAKTAGEALDLARGAFCACRPGSELGELWANAVIEWHEAQQKEDGVSVEDARAILQELREWRSGKRRVFFRVGRTDYFGESYEDDCVRKPRKKEDGVSVTKVFVRPKGAKK